MWFQTMWHVYEHMSLARLLRAFQLIEAPHQYNNHGMRRSSDPAIKLRLGQHYACSMQEHSGTPSWASWYLALQSGLELPQMHLRPYGNRRHTPFFCRMNCWWLKLS
jgi:hypothetical protein